MDNDSRSLPKERHRWKKRSAKRFVGSRNVERMPFLERVRVLGNLSNPYAYEFTDDDVRAIFAAIENELKLTKLKFQNQRRREFKLE